MIPGNVRRDLARPIIFIVLESFSAMLRAAMPKATIDEDGHTSSREHYVGLSLKAAVGRRRDPVTKSLLVQDPPHSEFRLGVPGSVRLHVTPTAGRRCPGFVPETAFHAQRVLQRYCAPHATHRRPGFRGAGLAAPAIKIGRGRDADVDLMEPPVDGGIPWWFGWDPPSADGRAKLSEQVVALVSLLPGERLEFADRVCMGAVLTLGGHEVEVPS